MHYYHVIESLTYIITNSYRTCKLRKRELQHLYQGHNQINCIKSNLRGDYINARNNTYLHIFWIKLELMLYRVELMEIHVFLYSFCFCIYVYKTKILTILQPTIKKTEICRNRNITLNLYSGVSRSLYIYNKSISLLCPWDRKGWIPKFDQVRPNLSFTLYLNEIHRGI